MKIGQLADATGTQVETIRYYERAGLIAAPSRTDGNYRSYGEQDVARLNFIRHCRCLDMTLEEIRELLQLRELPQADCGPADAILDNHIRHVVQRIRELKALEKELRQLQAECTTAGQRCGIIGRLEKAGQEHQHVAPTSGHLAGVHGRAPTPTKGPRRDHS